MSTTASDFDRVVMDFMNDDPLTVTYQSNTTVFNDSTGNNTITSVNIPCQAILLEVSVRPQYGDGTKDATLIQQGDKLLFIRPPEKVDPYRLPLVINTTEDRVIVGTTTYKIVTSKQTNPSAANCILYELYIRK